MTFPRDPEPPDEGLQAQPSPHAAGNEDLATSAAQAGPHYCLRCSRRLRPFRLHALERPCCPECRLPYNPADPDTYATAPRPRWRYWVPAAVLVVLNGSLVYAVIFWMNQSGPAPQLGTALFLAVPFSMGALLGYLTRPGVWGALLLSALAVLILAFVMFMLSLHGMFCFMTLGLFAVIPALVGAAFGWFLRMVFYQSAWDGRRTFFLLGLGAMPFGVDQIERQFFPLGIDIAEVRTEAVFPAPPARTWDSIVFYEQVEHKPPWLVRFALPRPLRAEGSKENVGDRERCVYRKGYLVKVITERTAGERLAFRVSEHHLHIERNVTLIDGAFLLTPMEGGQTCVTLTTRYQRHLRPAWLWEWVERRVVHTLHGHVLEGMRRRLDAPMRPSPSDPPRPNTPVVLGDK